LRPRQLPAIDNRQSSLDNHSVPDESLLTDALRALIGVATPLEPVTVTRRGLRRALEVFGVEGRRDYAEGEEVPGYALAALAPSEPRRLRDGVNYGVGVRYDVTPALGLRLEYARFSRFAGEAVTGPLPDSDQVKFGMQFRF